MDYNKKQLEYAKIIKNIEKSKQMENENNLKIKKLKEWKEQLDKIAEEMYNIQELKDFKLLQKSKNENKEKLKNLEKKYDVLSHSKKINVNKYSQIISINEKEIFKLNQNKIELMEELEKQQKINDKLIQRIKQFYGYNENNINLKNKQNDLKNNLNNTNNKNKKEFDEKECSKKNNIDEKKIDNNIIKMSSKNERESFDKNNLNNQKYIIEINQKENNKYKNKDNKIKLKIGKENEFIKNEEDKQKKKRRKKNFFKITR